jgi:hypothetical protein
VVETREMLHACVRVDDKHYVRAYDLEFSAGADPSVAKWGHRPPLKF